MRIAALAHARRAKATFCIAKLDRLARNMAFTANLMESGVDFVAYYNPHVARLTMHILAAVAEDEARRTSERTRAALLAYKARGGKLEKPENLTLEAVAASGGYHARNQESRRIHAGRRRAGAGTRGRLRLARPSGFLFARLVATGQVPRMTGIWTLNRVPRAGRPASAGAVPFV
jgi:hypothetical protein